MKSLVIFMSMLLAGATIAACKNQRSEKPTVADQVPPAPAPVATLPPMSKQMKELNIHAEDMRRRANAQAAITLADRSVLVEKIVKELAALKMPAEYQALLRQTGQRAMDLQDLQDKRAKFNRFVETCFSCHQRSGRASINLTLRGLVLPKK